MELGQTLDMGPQKGGAVARRNAQRLGDMGFRLFRPAERDFGQADPRVGCAEVSVQRQGPLEFSDAAGGAVGQDLDVSQPEMGPMVARMDGEPLEQQRLGRREPLTTVVAGIDCAKQDIDPRRADERVDIGRVELDGLLEKLTGSHEVVAPPFVEGGRAPEIIVERIGIGLVFRPLRLGRDQFRRAAGWRGGKRSRPACRTDRRSACRNGRPRGGCRSRRRSAAR